jgi:hypothetical protein
MVRQRLGFVAVVTIDRSVGRNASVLPRATGAADLPFSTVGTTIQIARSHHPSCVSGTAGDLRLLRTVPDRW